jgi:hypothetical protein
VTDRVGDLSGDLHELIDSLRGRGQINPVTIKDDRTLAAGEHRAICGLAGPTTRLEA